MKYEIWIEGYAAQEERAKAYLVEEVEADSFQEACDKCKLANYKEYNSKNLSVWGCRLYQTEAEARKLCG